MAYTTYRHQFMEGDSRRASRSRRYRARGKRLMFRGRPRPVRRHRIFAGVCGGLAEHLDISPIMLRLAAIGTLVLPPLGALAVLTYIFLTLWMPPQHAVTYDGPFEEPISKDEYHQTPAIAMSQLEDQYADIERRIQQLEDIVTSKEFDLKRKFDNL
ncbi:PspC domain-containing protein [Acanthopleuribacter pedis]|uniref:PspC domain-containing protein n=1 Tax=Acanthopleuribacter pedis TaxID=442870 RepID=A0A8J7U5Y9_9BACT|nr:PspC domain-containing protein [Acanthopleuribacter pedis]MBO1321344.1 PspC domain-containing protein [Acanthopleuribacter pedis]